jgi:hypothetical protein
MMVWTLLDIILFTSNIILLVTINKFDPNLVLVNINKLKPYMFIENKTLQPTLVKLGDLVTNEPIQTKDFIPLLIEPKDFQPIRFESIIIIEHLVTLK